MKKTILIFSLLASSLSYGQNQKCNCIQVMSTQNIHLIEPSQFEYTGDTAFVEKTRVDSKEYYRVLFCFENFNDAVKSLEFYNTMYNKVVLTEKKRSQIQELKKLFASL
jgi:hypothetical protein